jgi:hypothetical protein
MYKREKVLKCYEWFHDERGAYLVFDFDKINTKICYIPKKKKKNLNNLHSPPVLFLSHLFLMSLAFRFYLGKMGHWIQAKI